MGDYIEKKFVKFKRAKSNVQVDCYHNVSPGKEFFVEEIVREISDEVNCSSVVARFSRFDVDLNREIGEDNREAVLEYREVLEGNLGGKKSYLLVVFHGMKNQKGKDIEIGTREGRLASPKICEWFVSSVKSKFSKFIIVVDEEFKGNRVLEEHRQKLGETLNIFQVELSRDIREENRREIVDGFAQILREFERDFVDN